MAACFGNIPDDEQKCTNCNSTDLQQTRDGDLTCLDCGCCMKGRCFDTTLETRQFDEDDGEAVRVERVGTYADPNALAATGVARMGAGQKTKANVGGLNRAAQNTTDKRELKNVENSQKLKELAARVGVNDTTHREAFRMFMEYEQLVSFKEVEEVMLACLYIACRNEGQQGTRQFKELAAQASKRMSPTQIHARVQSICQKLKINMDTSTVTAENFTMRYGASLGLLFPIKQLAYDIAHNISHHGLLEGKNPRSNAAIALWMACKIKAQEVPVADIATQCEIAATTIRKNWVELYPSRTIVVPLEFSVQGEALPPRM